MKNRDTKVITICGVTYQVEKVKRVFSRGSYYTVHIYYGPDNPYNRFFSTYLTMSEFRKDVAQGIANRW